jgi:hypothetical protein
MAEQEKSAFAEVSEGIARLKEDRAALLAACKAALDALQHEDDPCECSDVYVCPRCEKWCHAMDATEAAIAKAEA